MSDIRSRSSRGQLPGTEVLTTYREMERRFRLEHAEEEMKDISR